MKHSKTITTLLLATLSFILPISTYAANKKPLNIVVIMADDLGWMDLHCQGNKKLDTPNLDKLATQGMRFTNAYAAAPVCTPTRAAMMTGQTPARLHITNHAPGNIKYPGKKGKLQGAQWTTYLSLDYQTIAERLKAEGYATGFLGKWHLSHRRGSNGKGRHEPQLRPEHQGYDLNIGGLSYGGPPTYWDPYKIENIKPRKKGEYLPERLADEAIAFMTKNKNKPFFLSLWSYAVHYPWEAPQHLVDKYKPRKGPGIKNPTFAAQIEAMDQSYGRVFKALDDLNLTDNTLLIFKSDNGSWDGDNRPLRGAKGYLYEGGIRIPFIVRWPGVTKPNTLCHTPIISMDTFPTILQALNLKPNPGQILDGKSIIPLLKGATTLNRDALYFHYPNYAFHKGNRPGSAIRQGDYKLIKRYDDNSIELYNLTKDLSEKNNLAKKYPQRAQKMLAKLDAWLKETNANFPRPINAISKQ